VNRPIPRASAARVPQIAGRLPNCFPSPQTASFGALKSLLGTLAVTSLFVSCAVQGPPLPPRVERPVQIKDLGVTQKGRTFELTFTLPALATDGERLTKPLEIEIYRTVTPHGAAAAPFPETATPAVVLKPNDLRGFTFDKEVLYPFELSEKEYSSSLREDYTFAVRGLTYGFRHRALEGQLSNVRRATLLDVSGPVENLQVQTTEKAIEVTWSPPTQSLSGRPITGLSGYPVYRSDSGKKGSFELRTVASSPAYSDTDLTFDHSYYYKVQVQFRGDHSTAESAASPAVEITPRDVFPPAAPRHVRAIYAAGAVQIVWSPSTATDLAGYNILRREDGGQETKINEELARTPVFRDTRVEAGKQYSYRITAQDLSGNVSAPSEAAEVETR
jgi:fibronectin type 3 domain-containing protein